MSKIYYLYHIPGKKIGVTCNLKDRVTKQQGYKPSEYEILEKSEDIDYISNLEIELQKEYGYKVDITKYNTLTKTNKKMMKVNPTEQTSTFPVPLNKLKGRLNDNIGLSWKTPQGYSFKVTKENISWLVKNARTSMFNENRCYIYNKAFYEFNNKPEVSNDANQFELIREWATVRGLYEKGDAKTQYVKLQEEAGELAKALLKNDEPEIIDAIGDIVVVLTNLSHLAGYKIEDCIQAAYDVISKRTGKMINGTFVKSESL